MAAYLYLAQIAIPQDIEDAFNRLYDEGYLPNLRKVPGVERAERYKLEWSDVPDMPEYLAIYDIAHPEVPKSEAWKNASIACGWAETIRPFMTVRRHGLFRKVAQD